MRRITSLVALLVAVTPMTTVVSGGPAPALAASAFHTTPCPNDVFPDEVEVDCGYVVVPERWGHPAGKKIQVAAAYVHAPAAGRHGDPIVFLDGGPSFGAISPFALGEYFADWTGLHRDIVLVDTRGTGYSVPRLGCPEVDEAEVTTFYAPPFVNSQAPSVMGRAIKHCWNRLVKSGVDPSVYTTTQSAADLEALRTALGVTRWNLLALSADGQLGLTYLRLYPQGIRSAIIDAGISTQVKWGLDYDRGVVRELNRVFAGCSTNTTCAARFPNVGRLFYRLVKRLQHHPVDIRLPDFQPHPVTLEIDGGGLVTDAAYGIWPGNAYAPQEIGSLLDNVWRFTHGELKQTYRELLGTGPVENDHSEDSIPTGKSLSYLCHDSVSFLTRKDLRQAAREMPWFAGRYLSHDYDFADGYLGPLSPAGCRSWPVGSAPAVQNRPVHSSVPTLAFGGEYDLGVPPYMARQVVARLSHATYVEVPAASHLLLSSSTNGSACSRSIAEAFLDSPTLKPDISCVADLPRFDFGAAVG